MKNQVSRSEIVKSETGFQLLVDGKPFQINGAGLEFGSVKSLADEGGNAFRTWRVENGEKSGEEVLDEAQKYGLKVMMGIEVARERHGFDYDDQDAVSKQLDRIRNEVTALKDHPALIIWGIGNELNLHATNPKVWNAVEDIVLMIKEVDPNHVTTTSLAGFDLETVNHIKTRVPSIDVLSVQLYGELGRLPNLVKEVDWKGPLIVSEWGATGYWEVPLTKWEAPIEENSTVKAAAFYERFQKGIAPLQEQCLGSFVFLWGQKQERTSTWFGMFTPEGGKTEVVDVLHRIWYQKWPENSATQIGQLRIEGKLATESIYLKAKSSYDATLELKSPPEGLLFNWTVRKETESKASGGDFEEEPEIVAGCITSKAGEKLAFTSPEKSGAYRLYVDVLDVNGYTAHANIPFFVK